MNSKLLLIPVFIVTLASCSTAYKTGQTPDDVYYSPARYYGEERENKKEENRETAQNRTDYSEERQIRLGINDRRWRYLDNDIYYNPYQFGYNYGYYYNPFYYNYPVYSTCPCACVISNPKTTTPRMTNLGGYGTGYNYVNTPVNSKYNNSAGRTGGTPVRSYNNSNNNTGSKLGNTLNKVFNNSNNSSNNNTNSSNNRTYSPSSSSSGSSSGSSSSSGSTSRPARNGKN